MVVCVAIVLNGFTWNIVWIIHLSVPSPFSIIIYFGLILSRYVLANMHVCVHMSAIPILPVASIRTLTPVALPQNSIFPTWLA